MSIRFCPTCVECFEVTIAIARALRSYYSRMSEAFKDEVGVSEIFRLMAQDESDFARTLEQTKEHGVHSPATHTLAEEFSRRLSNLLTHASDSLDRTPGNLDEAWLLACDLERSEANEVYLMLTAELAGLNGPKGDFIAKHVNNHVQRLRELGRRYDVTRRQAILPNHPALL